MENRTHVRSLGSVWRSFNFQQHKIMLAGANLFAEFGNLNPESWREIMLCNTALFTKLVDLDRFVTVLKASLHIRMTVAYSSRNTV